MFSILRCIRICFSPNINKALERSLRRMRELGLQLKTEANYFQSKSLLCGVFVAIKISALEQTLVWQQSCRQQPANCSRMRRRSKTSAYSSQQSFAAATQVCATQVSRGSKERRFGVHLALCAARNSKLLCFDFVVIRVLSLRFAVA